METNTNSRKIEIYEIIKDHTDKYLLIHDFEAIGMDASNLALDLHLDRANISRILNSLHKDGKLIKIQGRPTFFIAKDSIKKISQDIHIPNTLKKGESLRNFVEEHSSIEKNNYSRLYNCIGSHQNESLYNNIQRIKSAISYPTKGINILIQGAKYTDKLYLSQLVLEEYLNTYQLKITNSFFINCYNHNLESFFNELKQNQNTAKSKVVLLTNIDNLVRESVERFQSIISLFLTDRLSSQKKDPFVIATSNIVFDGSHLSQLKTIYPTILNIPKFDDRTIKEKIEYVLRMFQNEATAINHTISLNKNIINCFTSSTYETNMQNLANEIRYAISNAFIRKNNSNIIQIEFEDISDEVLNKIVNASTFLSELESIYNIIDTNDFFFIPNSECKALMILKQYHLNNDLTINSNSVNIKTDITNFCSQEIKKTKDLKINTIRSIIIKQIYDCVYPNIRKSPIIQNEKTLYGLLQHISKVISDIKRDAYNPSYKNQTNELVCKNHLIICKNIKKELDKEFKISLPELEIDYMACYIAISENLIINKEVAILILCYGDDIAKNYAKYINTLENKSTVHYIDYSLEYQKQNFSEFQKVINAKVKEIDKGHGVIIASDIEPLTSLDSTIHTQTGIKSYILSPISLPLLLKIMKIANNLNCSLDDFKHLDNKIGEEDEISVKHQLAQDKIINVLEEKILSESLVFLNPKKSSNLLFNVLLSILKDLELNYSSDIVVKFVIHSCFVIERTIKKETIKFKHLNTFINDFNKEYLAIEKEFVIVNKTFGINVHPSELAMITQIFIEYKKIES